MTLQLLGHLFSSYTWKALIPLYENATPFTFRSVDGEHPGNGAEVAETTPLGKFPLLIHGNRRIFEASSIIEYLDVFLPGPVRFIPVDPWAAVEVRTLDRVFDNYVMNQANVAVANALRPEDKRDPYGVEQARNALDRTYKWLEGRLAGREWAAGDAFTLADCAAAPSLFYADWVHPFDDRFPALTAYRARLLARPSVARAVDDARPFRPYFPLGAPDRD